MPSTSRISCSPAGEGDAEEILVAARRDVAEDRRGGQIVVREVGIIGDDERAAVDRLAGALIAVEAAGFVDRRRVVGEVGDVQRHRLAGRDAGIAGDDAEIVDGLGLEVRRGQQPHRAVRVDAEQAGIGARQRIGDPVAVGVVREHLIDDRAGRAVLGDVRARAGGDRGGRVGDAGDEEIGAGEGEAGGKRRELDGGARAVAVGIEESVPVALL